MIYKSVSENLQFRVLYVGFQISTFIYIYIIISFFDGWLGSRSLREKLEFGLEMVVFASIRLPKRSQITYEGVEHRFTTQFDQ